MAKQQEIGASPEAEADANKRNDQFIAVLQAGKEAMKAAQEAAKAGKK